MALKCCEITTKYIIWTIPLPHPHRSCKSPKFSLDGSEWCFEVNCILKKVYAVRYASCEDGDCASYGEAWRIKLVSCSKDPVSTKNYIVVPYIEKSHPVYECRADDDMDRFEFDRKSVGTEKDFLKMLFLFAPSSLRIGNDIPRVTYSKPQVTGLAQLLSFENLSNDMVKLLDGKEHSNVTLKWGGSDFRVHKAILAARSDVFAGMFGHGSSGSKSGVVNTVNLNSPVLKQFVRYLYSGKVEEMTMDKAIELYKVAERYAVDSLKQFCASFMSGNLSEEFVCKILFLADQVADSTLLEAATRFAVRSATFLKTEEWKTFALKNPTIGLNVLFNECFDHNAKYRELVEGHGTTVRQQGTF